MKVQITLRLSQQIIDTCDKTKLELGLSSRTAALEYLVTKGAKAEGIKPQEAEYAVNQ